MSYEVEQQSEYQLVSAILSNSERNAGFDLEIKNIISSFQIFEHIEKPYLTAQFVVVDTADLIQDYDFQGAEKITIEIIQAEEQNEGTQITKEFLVPSITICPKSRFLLIILPVTPLNPPFTVWPTLNLVEIFSLVVNTVLGNIFLIYTWKSWLSKGQPCCLISSLSK